MSEWKDFLRKNDSVTKLFYDEKPGPVLINFVNRYIEPLDSVTYRVEYEGKIVRGLTTQQNHTVEVSPSTTQTILVFVWSKLRGEFKLITQLTPQRKQRLLVNIRLKTFRHQSKTEAHPKSPMVETPKQQPESSGKGKEVKWGGSEQGVESAQTKNKKEEPEHKTRRSQIEKILTEQLKKIFPAAGEKFLDEVADELNVDLEKYKLDTPLRRAHFFAQVRQEAGPSLSPKQECLNYRPEVLIEKFSYYKSRPEEARSDGRLEEVKVLEKIVGGRSKTVRTKTVLHAADQVKIANKAYQNNGENGNADSGDGWRFRGRGIFQLTLRSNYKQFNEEYPNIWPENHIDFLLNPDKICDFPYFVRSAVWYWMKNKIYAKADCGGQDNNVDEVTRKINGPAMDAAVARRKNFHELSYPAFK